MASTRFINDRGLTARMTLVMFLLGALFVALIVGLMSPLSTAGLAPLIGIAGIGVAWFQWYNSDKVALKAMRARVVTPEEAPELHGDDRPALRAGRHAQAAGGDRLHRHAQRVRHRPVAAATRRCA